MISEAGGSGKGLALLFAAVTPAADPAAERPRRDPPGFSWRFAFIVAALCGYFYVFTEWLFFATKPSFMTSLSAAGKFAVFLGTAPVVAIAALAATALTWLVCRVLPQGLRERCMRWLAFSVSAAVLACCFFLLIDNFTYTLFGFGALTAIGPLRIPYALLLIVLFAWTLRKLARLQPSERALRRFQVVTAVLLLASATTLVVQFARSRSDAVGSTAAAARPQRTPNILLLASDGVEAGNMSAYGYERDTTPFIAGAMAEALVAENGFPNGTATAGSVVSMLTSKLPLHTRVYQHQNILTDEDAYQHLPGLLRDVGYRTMSISVDLFSQSRGVPRPWNMRNAFDNYEKVGGLPPGLGRAYAPHAHFFAQMSDRIADRLLHTSGERTARRAFAEFLLGRGETDPERIGRVLEFVDESDRPFFAHLHLMGTHPPYSPNEVVFSGGRSDEEIALDGYDNSIRSFDDYLRSIFEHLRRSGKLDDTIIVLTSDHGRDWSFTRVPLMFFFPRGEHRGVLRANTQLLDVAPTILDYMGVAAPPWMEGQSLLAGEPDPLRPIRSVETVSGARAPYPQMGRIGVTVCQRSTWLKLRVGKLRIDHVADHTAPCPLEQLPPLRKQRAELIADLARSGYPVGHLRRRPVPPR